MGKIKRKKPQLHNKPIKPKLGDRKQVEDKHDIDGTEKPKDAVKSRQAKVIEQPAAAPLTDNIFSNLKIDNQLLAQKLPDFDARSSVTNKSLKGLNLKKKDKRKIRHEVFMQKIDAIQTAKHKAKEKKKREKTPVVGDMSVMEEALPTLELLLKEGSKSQKQTNPTKVRGVQKEKKRKTQMLSDMSIFKQVLEHPAFRSNPTATISEHLHNKLQQENQEMDM